MLDGHSSGRYRILGGKQRIAPVCMVIATLRRAAVRSSPQGSGLTVERRTDPCATTPCIA